MQPNPFAALNQAISQLITSNSATLQATGLDIFRGLAVILIAWFGIKSALSAAQGHGGGFHFARFADLILMISFGLGMLTYYSFPIPGVGYSFSDLVTKEAQNISNQIESDQTQQIANTILDAEKQLGTPPGKYSILEDLTYLLIAVILAAMEAVAFAVIAYGLVASAVCVLIGPMFIPWFIVPKMDWLFWGWFKAFIGFSFYQVIASATAFVLRLQPYDVTAIDDSRSAAAVMMASELVCGVLIHARQGDLAGRLIHCLLEADLHVPVLLVDRAGDLAPVRYADMVLP